MKKAFKVIIITVISIFISIIFTSIIVLGSDNPKVGVEINTEDYLTSAVENDREFTGLADPAKGEKFFNDLVREASYLCAWHGGMFFNKKPIVIDIDIRIFYVNHKLQYTVNDGEEKWGYFQESPTHRAEFENLPFIITADKYKYYWVKRQTNESWDDITKVWESFGLKLVATQYSGDKYITSVEEKYGEEARYASVTSSGRTRYTPVETHYELNTQLAYLLSDCDDNANTAPRNSYVNVAFWHYLSYPPTGTTNPYGNKGYPPPPPASPASTSSQINVGQPLSSNTSASDLVVAAAATDSNLTTLEEYLKRLKDGGQLTEKECDNLYALAVATADDVKAWEILTVVNEYKSDPTKVENIKNLENQLTELTTVVTSNTTATGKAAELIQNAQDFRDMWEEIYKKGTYEDTISDTTDINNVTVEYNATTQEYIVGPFTLEYMEKYTHFQGNDIILAGMAGDPVLTVNIDGSPVTLPRSGGEWEFYFKGARISGIPDGYEDYPHNGEQFYIKLKYQDGLNAIMNFEVFFKYMQAEAYWTKSTGEIEQVKWKANFGTNGCNAGRCDGGYYDGALNRDLAQCHSDNNAGGVTHYHPDNSDNHNMGDSHTNCNHYDPVYVCPGHDGSCSSSCPDDCTSSHTWHHTNDIGCEGHYECLGHVCKTYANPTPNSFQTYSGETQYGIPCEHGFYGCHYSKVFFHMNGQYIGSIPIQYIATCHFAYRRYYDVNKKFDWDIDLTTMLEGDVWLDKVAQKDNSIMEKGTGIKESGEHGVQDALVTIKVYQYNGGDATYVKDAIMHNQDGSVDNSWPKKTDGNGHYYVDRIEAPGNAGGGGNCFYVAEFQYDGQVYESTIFLSNGSSDDTAQQFMDAQGVGYADKSLAVENAVSYSSGQENREGRKEFDAKFTEISGESDFNGSTTEGKAGKTSESKEVDIKYNGKTQKDTDVPDERASDRNGAEMIRSEFESAATEDHENMRSGWEGSDYYQQYNLKSYTYYNGSTGETKANSKDYKIMFPMSDKGTNYGSGDVVYTLNKKRTGNAVGNKRYIDEYMLHINLGLQKRKETDISLLKDLYKMTVVVNEQELVKNYNNLGPQTDGSETITIKYDGSYATLKGHLESERKSREKYTLGLYESDVQYASGSRYKDAADVVEQIKKNTELRVFATYAIRIYNNSDTNDVKINEVIDYYDTTYSVVDNGTEMSEGHIGYDATDGIHCPIIDEKTGAHSNKLVADKPYYRVLSATDDATGTAAIWKPTKQQNLEGMKRTGDVSWSDAGTAGGMKKSTTNSLNGEVLKVNEYIEIFTTYEIDYKGFVDMTTNTTSDANTDTKSLRPDIFSKDPDHKNNVAELSNYTTYYSERDDEDPKSKKYYKPYVRDQVSGKIDKDSAPDNVPEGTILDITKYEDDTCRAIPVEIALEQENRQMYGYVFEDKKGDPDQATGLKMGDGLYASGDVLVPEVKVSMYEVITLNDINKGNEIKYDDLEYYYEVPQACYNKGAEIITTKDVGNNGNYRINGYLAGDYVLRFDYGTRTDATETLYTTNENGDVVPENNVPIIKYNGQDYENTAFLAGVTYPDAGSAINDKYLNLRKEDMRTADEQDGIQAVIYKDENENKQYSVARDNEARRMVVNAFSRTLENARGELLRDRRADDELYSKATFMFAETPIMQIEINDPKNLDSDTRLETDQGMVVIKTEDALNITTREYHINKINFGLEERAKTDIKLEEYIESIMLMKNNEIVFGVRLKENDEGKWVVDKTHQDSQHLDKLAYMTRYDAGNTQQGFYAISVEDDYLNGMTMKIDYRIKIINDSEVDYTGELARYYRANEILERTKSSPTTEGYQAIIKDWTSGTALPVNKDTFSGLASNTVLAELIQLYGTDAAISKLLGNSGDAGAGTTNLKHDTIRPDTIVYGQYVGRYYYENKVGKAGDNYTIKNYRSADKPNIQISYDADNVVKTTVNQLINYVDVNASYDLSTQGYENSAWDLSGNIDATSTERENIDTLDSLVSKYSYRKVNEKFNIYDEKDKALVTDVSSNIVISKNNKMNKMEDFFGDTNKVDTYLNDKKNDRWIEYREDYQDVGAIDNTNLDIELVPKSYKGNDEDTSETEMWIMTTKTASSDTESSDMSFDNLVEVLVYSNTTGRRDVYSVPGNAMVLGTKQGFWKAGYNSKEYWLGNGATEPYLEVAAKQWATYPEDDAYAPEFVTIIAPTGITLRDYIKNIALPIAVLIITMIAMAGVFGVKQIGIHKRTKED